MCSCDNFRSVRSPVYISLLVNTMLQVLTTSFSIRYTYIERVLYISENGYQSILKGALKAHILISLYESNTLRKQDAALLFLSVIP